MNLALWSVAIVLAVVFAGSGLMKLVAPKDKLVNSGQGWAQDVSPTNIRLIGLVEVLGAAVVHARRNEPMYIAVNVVLLALAVFVVWGRFGPYPLGGP